MEPTGGSQGAGGLNDYDDRIELVDDTLTLNEEFKKNVAIPYFKDIYKDLVAQSDAKSKGINRVSMLTVSYTPIHTHTHSNLRANIYQLRSRDGDTVRKLHLKLGDYLLFACMSLQD